MMSNYGPEAVLTETMCKTMAEMIWNTYSVYVLGFSSCSTPRPLYLTCQRCDVPFTPLQNTKHQNLVGTLENAPDD